MHAFGWSRETFRSGYRSDTGARQGWKTAPPSRCTHKEPSPRMSGWRRRYNLSRAPACEAARRTMSAGSPSRRVPAPWARKGCAMSEWNWAAGQMPKPLNDEMQEERQAELREESERQHLANEASKSKRRWWKFWSRAEK